MIGGEWLSYLSAQFTRAFFAYSVCESVGGLERFSQQQLWLPQGLAAATVPGAISVELLWLTVTLSNLNPQATAISLLEKMDSHGLSHILTAQRRFMAFAFVCRSLWSCVLSHASDYAALMAPIRARLFTLNSLAKPYVDLKQRDRLNAAFARQTYNPKLKAVCRAGWRGERNRGAVRMTATGSVTPWMA